MLGSADSLNGPISASILAYEARAQSAAVSPRPLRHAASPPNAGWRRRPDCPRVAEEPIHILDTGPAENAVGIGMNKVRAVSISTPAAAACPGGARVVDSADRSARSVRGVEEQASRPIRKKASQADRPGQQLSAEHVL